MKKASKRFLRSVFLAGQEVGRFCSPKICDRDGIYTLSKEWIPGGLDPISELVYWLGCEAGFAWNLGCVLKEVEPASGGWRVKDKLRRGSEPWMSRELMVKGVKERLLAFEERGCKLKKLVWYREELAEFFCGALKFTEGKFWYVHSWEMKDVLEDLLVRERKCEGR